MVPSSEFSHVQLGATEANPARSDANEKSWIWPMEEGSDLFLDVGDIVNFRIEKELWHDQAPAPPKVSRQGETETDTAVDYKIPYSIEVWYLFSLARDWF